MSRLWHTANTESPCQASESRVGFAAHGERRVGGSTLPRLLLGMGLGYLPVAIALPLLPAVVLRDGGGPLAVGLVIGAESVTAMLVRPAVGWLAAHGHRRELFAAACAVTATATAANAAASAVWGLVITRLVLGVGSGASRAVAQGWAVEVAPASRRGHSVGLIGIVTTLTVAVGPLIGFALSRMLGIDRAWVVAAAMALLGAGTVRGLPEPPTCDAPPPHLARRSIGLTLPSGVGVAICFASYAALAAFAAVALGNRGIAGGSSVLTTYALGVVTIRMLFGGATDRHGSRATALVSAGVQAFGLLLLAVAWSLPLALAAGALVGAGVANVYPALAMLALERGSREERAVISATLGSFVDIGIGIGAPLAGLLAGRTGYTTAFIALAATLFVAVAVIVNHVDAGDRARRGWAESEFEGASDEIRGASEPRDGRRSGTDSSRVPS